MGVGIFWIGLIWADLGCWRLTLNDLKIYRTQENFAQLQYYSKPTRIEKEIFRNVKKNVTKNNGKIGTSAIPGKLYINRKELMRVFQKYNFDCN